MAQKILAVIDPTDRSDGDTLVWDSGSSLHVYQPYLGGLFNNLSATAPPTVNDDTGDGYVVGSLWVDTTNDMVWMATDVSSGAAVWRLLSGAAYVRASRSTAQTITTATDTPITFDTEEWDSHGFFTPSSTDFTIPTGLTGFYIGGAECAWDSTSATGYGQVYGYNNTTAKIYGDDRKAASSSFQIGGVASFGGLFTAGDVVRCHVRHTKGSNRDTVAGRAALWMALVKKV